MDIFGLLKKINMMDNNKEKQIKICTLYSYLNFLVNSNQITKKEATEVLKLINEPEVFLKGLTKVEIQNVNSILDSIDELNFLYKNILLYANNYHLFRIDIPDVNIQNLLSHAFDFLKYFDIDAYDLYQKLYQNNLIVECNINDFGGTCQKIDGEKSGIILRYNTASFYKIVTLIHEIGHAYYHYLDKTTPNLNRTKLTNEVMSRIFEQLFLLYLKENYLIDNNSINLYERFFHVQQIGLLNASHIINELLLNNIISPQFHIEEIEADLSKEDFKKLSIQNKPILEFQKFVKFESNYYAYAYLFSNIIRERFRINQSETKKLIKDIPYLSRIYTANEFINLFDKQEYLNSTKKNINRVLKKNYYK